MENVEYLKCGMKIAINFYNVVYTRRKFYITFDIKYLIKNDLNNIFF